MMQVPRDPDQRLPAVLGLDHRLGTCCTHRRTLLRLVYVCERRGAPAQHQSRPVAVATCVHHAVLTTHTHVVALNGAGVLVIVTASKGRSKFAIAGKIFLNYLQVQRRHWTPACGVLVGHDAHTRFARQVTMIGSRLGHLFAHTGAEYFQGVLVVASASEAGGVNSCVAVMCVWATRARAARAIGCCHHLIPPASPARGVRVACAAGTRAVQCD